MADIKIFDEDLAGVYENAIQRMELAAEEPLYPGDERRTMTETLVQILAAISVTGNSCYNAIFLDNMEGEQLDQYGVNLGVERLPASGAVAVFEFTLSGASADDTVIPQGTLITTDGSLDFATDTDLTIPAGELTGQVSATCTTDGEDGNGYLAGTVASLVDGVSGVLEAHNVEETTGGAEEEDDDDLRERIKLAPSIYSAAGTEKRYRFYAKSASSSIVDAKVVIHDACDLYIYIMLENGLPNAAMLSMVQGVVGAADVRAFTDRVTVLPPEAVPYNIELTYFTTGEDADDCADTITAAIEGYNAWQSGKIGRDINPDQLEKLCLAPSEGTGCIRVDISSPALTKIGGTSVAVCGDIAVTQKIIDEDNAADT